MGEPKRALRVLALPCAIGLVAIGAAAVVPAAGGCQTHQCDADCVVRGAAPTASCSGGDDQPFGHASRNGNEILWESSPAMGMQSEPATEWLDYPGQRTYRLNWVAAVKRDVPDVNPGSLSVSWVSPYVSIYENGGFYVEAAGQLAEMSSTNQQVNVTNATCAAYFLRVVVALQVGSSGDAAGGDGAD